MDLKKYLEIKPVKHRIARGFLILAMVLSFFNALITYTWEQSGYAIGSLLTVLIAPVILYLGRYPRFNCLPFYVALLIPISFQFPAAIYSLKQDGPIYWFIAAPVFFFGLSNLYIGSILSVAMLASLIGNYLYNLYILNIALMPANVFISLIISYLFVLVLLWINERDRVDEETTLSDTANIDFLTKIKNRRGLELVLEHNQALLDRYKTPCAVTLLDLDDFKRVNDKYGHGVGDDVLINVANLCERSLRNTDIVGRWGGEEFVIISPGLDSSKAREMAEKLRQLLMSHLHVDVGVVTASFGVVSMHKGESLKSLMDRVDERMYEAKKTKNCVTVSE